jgi:nitrite reductase (NO-forming)
VRVVLVNGGLVLFALPVPSAVRVLTSMVVLGALVAFLGLAARAVHAALRPAASPPSGGVPAPGGVAVDASTPTPSRSGAAVVATGVLAMAVALGVAVDPAAAGIGALTVQAPVAATGHTTTVAVRALDMRFSPSTVEVPVGDRLVLEVTNEDGDVHELVVETGARSGRLAPGAAGTVDVGVVGSDLDGWCPIAGHRQMGMTLQIVAVGAPVAAAASTAAPGEHAGHDMGTMAGSGDQPTGDAADDLDLMATADASFRPRDATLPPAGPTTHRVTLTVQEVVREVAPGVTQTLWTFGGQAPGPVLHGRVGDRFEITLVNDGSIGHSVDFHAGALAPDDVMRTIQPGGSLTYGFTATRSGIWMYHCSTMPMSMHIANGMFGAVVVDPPGLPAVDREYVVVQSELYLGAQGDVADAAKIAAGTPDLVVFNGYANQYRDRPLTAVAGERVRFWVLDAGPNRPSAFHVVGGQFDTVYREGDWVLRDGGSTGTGGAQVLDLAPAQGGFVELTFPEPGTYAFVSHAMADAERGAVGRVRVTGR